MSQTTTTSTNDAARDLYVQLRLNNPCKLKTPSARDREIYHAVRIARGTLRDVGQQFKLSHARIHAIVTRYAKWLGNTSGHGDASDYLEREAVAEYNHRERLDYLFGKALQGYEMTLQEQQSHKVVTNDNKPDRDEKVTKSAVPNYRFLEMAINAEVARIEFEYKCGAVYPPPNEQQGPQEQVSELTKVVQNGYFDLPPSEREQVEDARLRQERERLELAERELKLQRNTQAAATVAAREAEKLREASKMSGPTQPSAKPSASEQAIMPVKVPTVEQIEAAKKTIQQGWMQITWGPIPLGKGQWILPDRNLRGHVETAQYLEAYRAGKIPVVQGSDGILREVPAEGSPPEVPLIPRASQLMPKVSRP